ncbi:hypothetical protein K503DRAFT_768699 [Rhizopogon vinicolor AM-OR11-026]|uniref:PH domain-containing protein n=1 Tax=Rhizopogon vinicolor AM-OR11-026 TaxID=1314800 RepID=A0A1B7N612_9AGAM|nr:hypothetical protein K503DRAFT_768699 [Rhizopogon vinicolor AM-OR11-026]
MNTSPTHKRKGGFLSQVFTLRRRNKNMHLTPYVQDPAADATPPTPPPKDYNRAFTRRPFLGDEYINEKPLLFDLELSVTAQQVLPHPPAQPIPFLRQIPPRVPVKTHSPPTTPLTPEERARRRLAAQRKTQLEKEAMLREEHERQERRKREKEDQERREREEEEKRKAALQEELRAAALRKARMEREEREIEERQLHEIRERKQLEKERRLQHTKEVERWRAEQLQRAESQCSEKVEERRRSAEGRRVRIARLNEEVFSSKADKMVGWVSVQAPDMLAWKRRYYKFEMGHAESKMLLYGNPREVVKPLDVLPLDGRIDSLAEWYEGFEELEAIPHSFAVRFVDGVEWRMYADSAEEKDRLLVLLSEAAGIIL